MHDIAANFPHIIRIHRFSPHFEFSFAVDAEAKRAKSRGADSPYRVRQVAPIRLAETVMSALSLVPVLVSRYTVSLKIHCTY